MCQSKAQGGRRCFSHAAIALEAALDHAVNTKAALEAATPDRIPDEQWATIMATPGGVARAWDTYNTAEGNHRTARAKIRETRWALAQTVRGNLEVHAVADTLEDAAATHGPGTEMRKMIEARAREYRAYALAASTGEAVHKVRERLTHAPAPDDRAERTEQLTRLRERSKTHPTPLYALLDDRQGFSGI